MAEPVHRLDFDGIKANLKNYLKDQKEFSDFNFEGAGMNILLDVLAYNTHYQGFYNNMVASEMFLDTARVRDSVVSVSKQLGYTPRSSRASRAIVNIYDSGANPLVIKSGSKLTAKLNGKIYNFVTLTDYKFVADTVDSSGIVTKWVAKNVSVHEGTLHTYSFTVDETNKDQRFILPAGNIDTTSIETRVQKSFTDTSGYSKLWKQYNAISGIDGTSEVYHVQEAEDKQYELIFGDGIMGKKLSSGNIIRVVYLITKGTNEANDIGKNDREGARTFSITSVSGGKTKNAVVVVTPSAGGEPVETIRSVKFNAPKFFQTQNRAITADDYETLVRKDFPNIDAMTVWGGEDNDPPQYGKVFLAIKPKSGTKLSLEDKVSITKSILKEKTIVGLSVEIADPDITYVKVSTHVLYDDNATALTIPRIEKLVINRIKLYGQLNLDQFSEPLYYSHLCKDIDETTSSILSNFTLINLEKRIEPVVGVEANYILKYENAFHHPHDGHKSIVKSSSFSYSDEEGTKYNICSLIDDGNDTMQIIYMLDGKQRVLIPNIGSINYTTGIINLINFAPTSIVNNILKIQVVPSRYDVDTSNRTILSLDENDVSSIKVVVEKLSERGTTTGSSNGQGY